MRLRSKRKAKPHVPVNKSLLSFGEPERVRDRRWLDQAPEHLCASCGKEAQVAAHIRTGNRGGTGLKPGDDCSDWACSKCHFDQENTPGAVWWYENVRKEPTTLGPQEWMDKVYIPKRKQAYREWAYHNKKYDQP